MSCVADYISNCWFVCSIAGLAPGIGDIGSRLGLKVAEGAKEVAGGRQIAINVLNLGQKFLQFGAKTERSSFYFEDEVALLQGRNYLIQAELIP